MKVRERGRRRDKRERRYKRGETRENKNLECREEYIRKRKR